LGDDDLRPLMTSVKVAQPDGSVHLLHRDDDYDDRARHRHLLAQHRKRQEVAIIIITILTPKGLDINRNEFKYWGSLGLRQLGRGCG